MTARMNELGNKKTPKKLGAINTTGLCPSNKIVHVLIYHVYIFVVVSKCTESMYAGDG